MLLPQPTACQASLRTIGVLLFGVALLLAACGADDTLTGDGRFAGASDAVAGSQPTATETATETPTTEPPPAATSSPTPAPASDESATQTTESDPDDDAEEAEASAADPDVPIATSQASATIINTRFKLGETFAFLDGSQPMVAFGVEVAHFGVADWDKAWTFSGRDVYLEDPTGRAVAIDAIYDGANRSKPFLSLDGKGRHDLLFVAETPALLVDAAGWDLVISPDGALGAHLPLDGPGYATSYPVVLRSGDQTQTPVAVGSTTCSDGIVADIVVDRSSVSLENFNNVPLRANPGARWVTIELEVSDTSVIGSGDTGPYYCGNSALWPDFVLLADGAANAPDAKINARLKEGSSGNIVLGYWIPADTTTIELQVGGSNASIARWDVELPAVAGEPDADLALSSPKPDSFNERNSLDLAGLEPNPDVVTVNEFDAQAATESVLFIDYTLRAARATNASLESRSAQANASTLDPNGRAYVVATLLVESDADADADKIYVHDHDFSLVSPEGEPWPVVAMYDQSGDDKGLLPFTGRDSEVVEVVFETKGLLVDADGWSVEVASDGAVLPARLPLTAPTEPSRAYELAAGAQRTIRNDVSVLCKPGTTMEAVVEQARVDIEGQGRFGLERVDIGQRLVTITLALTHIDPTGGPRGVLDYCGNLSFWPDFRVIADGRTFASLNDLFLVDIEHSTTETVEVTFEIPVETRSLELYGGSDPTLIASWELRDNAAVLNELDAVDDDDQTLITLNESVLFAFGESSLQRGAEGPLTRLASVLSTGSEGTINIVGHTDSIGDDASNQQLSIDRAQAVADFLVSAGVDEARLAVSGAGEAQPIASNTNDDGSDNPDGRAANRRVEVRFEISS